MLGSYEQVPPFGFRRKKVFDVVERGVEFRERLYEWNEIRDFQAISGIGSINFTDGTRCRIHMNSFRKQGERGHLSLFGGNPTFRNLAGYWYKKKLESLKSPKLEEVKSEITQLTDVLDSASNPDDVSRIGRKLTQANKEYLDLQVNYLKELDAEYEKFRGKQRIRIAMIFLALLIAIMAIAWNP